MELGVLDGDGGPFGYACEEPEIVRPRQRLRRPRRNAEHSRHAGCPTERERDELLEPGLHHCAPEKARVRGQVVHDQRFTGFRH